MSLLILALSIPVQTQTFGAFQLDRLNLLSTGGSGSRSMGMGGAYTAVSDDGFGLLYNPAGLTQIKKKEISFGINYLSRDIDTRYLGGGSSSIPVSSTGLGHLSVVYPYPTYRGSLVLGFGVFRVGDSEKEYYKSASRPDIGGRMDNSLIQSGTIYQYRFGAGVDISPRIALGGNLVVWDESIDFTEDLYFMGVFDSTYIFTDEGSAGLDGVSLELGFLFRLSKGLRAGLKITSPAWLSFDGEAYEYYDGTWRDGTQWYTDPYYYITEDEYTLPMKFRGGLSYQIGNVLLSVDAEYCDYTQTKYNGQRIYNERDRSKELFNSTLDFNLGIEVAVPFYPVKLRGGYSYMQERVTGFEELAYVVDTPEEFDIDSDWGYFDSAGGREFYSLGVGGLIDKVLKVDVNFIFGDFERKSSLLEEKTEVFQMAISGAYRF